MLTARSIVNTMREKSAARRVYEHPDVMRLILAELAGKKQVLKMMTLEKSFLPLAIDCLWRPTVLLERYQDWDASIVSHCLQWCRSAGTIIDAHSLSI